MLDVEAGESAERVVPMTLAPCEAYFFAREAPRPRVAPTTRMVGIAAISPIDVSMVFSVLFGLKTTLYYSGSWWLVAIVVEYTFVLALG